MNDLIRRGLRAFLPGLATRGRDAQTDRPPLSRKALTLDPPLIYAIGDVHGCLGKLLALEEIIHADGAAFPGPKVIVLLGDYIDRGPDSAKVLAHLQTPTPEKFYRVCLMGNHEKMLLDFLNGELSGQAWLDRVGASTMQSYGYDPLYHRRTLGLAMETLTDRFREDFPAEHRQFLEQLPVSLATPSYLFAHAGARPQRTIAEQSERDLLWMRWKDDTESGPIEGRRLFHGHTPGTEPVVTDYRVCVDTGACVGGPLTAARILDGALGFLQVP